MANAKTVRGTKILVMIGDGEVSESFAHNCSINGARSLQLSAQTNDTNVPDCDDPDLMAWVEREKVSLSGTIQGAGVTNTPDVEFFFDFLKDPDPRNVRVAIDVPGADGGGYFAGAWLCSDFTVNGDRGSKSDISITMQSTGVISWVDAA
jgi:hypothetical protein